MTANAKNLSTLANVLDSGSNGQFLQSTGSGGIVFADVAAGASVYDSAELLPLSGNDAGAMAYVNSTNRFYINNGSGWYSISLVNTNPNITSVQDASAGTTPFTLATDGTATVITITANDPEDVPLTYGYSVTAGSLTNGGGTTATVAQSDNVFTVTPSTTEAYAGTFSLTFTASDGINTATSANGFTLNFITIITDSKYTTLLATATDTSDNNNITDASSNNHTITVNGDAYAGTFSPYRHGGYSTYFPDTAGNAYVSANSSDYALGSGALTVSAWIYIDNNTQQQTIIDNQTGSGTGWYLKIWPGQLIRVHNQSSYIFNISNSDAPTAVNEWIHLCWTRDGSGNNKLFLNGTQVGTTVTDTTNFTAQGCKLGETYQGVNDYKGYMKDVHIVAGYANEPTTSSIATAVTSDTGTVFLGCSGPDFLERSSSPKTITINGNNIFIRPFSPYDNLEYSATDHGGSVFIEANGGHLSGTLSSGGLGTTFTVEMWIYDDGTGGNTTYGGYFTTTDIGSQYGIQLRRYGAYIFNSTTGTNLTWNANGNPFTTIFGIGWHHVAAVHNGSTFKVYVDGKEVISTSDSHTYSSVNYKVGQPWLYQSDGSQQAKAYISDLRINKSVIYSGEFTPPTAPLSSTGAELHIKGTDASIIDKSQAANLKLVGNTTGSTTTKFTGAKSMYFDGTGDGIVVPHRDDLNLNSCDWTIEYWFNLPNPGAIRNWTLIQKGDNSTVRPYALSLRIDNSNGVEPRIFPSPNNSSQGQISNNAWQTFNAWHHVAFVRVNSTGVITRYINGTANGTVTSNVATNTEDLYIGTVASAADEEGYIQDLRISKGKAHYTANFTPPTASLEG
jgi:hypothetical protein